jgi:NAD(P)-dependent dehydrogenase (short-subunit alcohol dehydrogenase family)
MRSTEIMGHLDGKVAIVTGAGRGIGRDEALLLAAEGAAVVVNDLGSANDGQGADAQPAHQVVSEIEAAGGRAVVDGSDISTWEGGEAVVQRALDAFGRLDILVCNAGIVRDRMVFNMSEEEWDAVIRVHLKGHMAPTRFATAYWREQAKANGGTAGGRIVFTSSHVGLYGNVGQVNYGAAKAGIAGLGLAVAREMERYGVTVNVICPMARTRLVDQALLALTDTATGDFDSMDPANIAPVVAYLGSDEAAHISGQFFGLTGGTVELLQGWSTGATIAKDGRWTVGELIARSTELFGDRPTGVPAHILEA